MYIFQDEVFFFMWGSNGLRGVASEALHTAIFKSNQLETLFGLLDEVENSDSKSSKLNRPSQENIIFNFFWLCKNLLNLLCQS